MAGYRNISVSFWTDSKVDDDFTPEDKYFYLYLMTNPHTSICGCYEISMKQMERETGYNTDTVKRLIQRMEEMHGVIKYSAATKEVLILHWWKYNWSSSAKVKSAVVSVAEHIKNEEFKRYVMDMVSIRYEHGMDTTDTDTVTDTDTDNRYRDSAAAAKPQKHKFGEFRHVLLTDEEYRRLVSDYGEEVTDKYIRKVDEYCEQSGKRYKNYNLAIRNTFMARDNQKPIRSQQPVPISGKHENFRNDSFDSSDLDAMFERNLLR